MEEYLPAEHHTRECKPKKTKRTVLEVSDPATESSDEEDNQNVQIPCYRMVTRSQQQQPHRHQEVPTPQPRLRASADKFIPVGPEAEIDQDERDPQNEILEEVENLIEGEDNQAQADGFRRSQRRARPKEMFTYGTLGQPSYQQWNAGVNMLMPSQPVPAPLNMLPFSFPYPTYLNPYPYLIYPHAY
ncbi:hypothetical protein N1851_029691 [Merluccius polli]|uniref:Uncharacterized protein n=1 Tax=Merluccius polli TaxID=89951 RepID=A0AA47NSG6_MERPO|nr:hypothetical protein N1851_029691 [Merluccius polli]